MRLQPSLYKDLSTLAHVRLTLSIAVCIWVARPHQCSGIQRREAALPLIGTLYGKVHSNASQTRRRRIRKEAMEGSGLVQMVQLSSYRKVIGVSNGISFSFRVCATSCVVYPTPSHALDLRIPFFLTEYFLFLIQKASYPVGMTSVSLYSQIHTIQFGM